MFQKEKKKQAAVYLRKKKSKEQYVFLIDKYHFLI